VRDVTVLAAGGTISSVEGGARLGAEALAEGLSVQARTLLTVNGPQLTNADALTLAAAAVAETGTGRGVVLTSGTDTIEELAVLCDAFLDADPTHPPVVVTGAIRSSDLPGADGPANLRDAIACAANLAGVGAVVCFAGEIHAARAVRKVDSTGPAAFGSPRHGPIGRVAEARAVLFSRPLRAPALPVPGSLDFRVPIVSTWLGDDGALLRAAVDAGCDGLVLAGLGAGHLPPPVLAALGDLPGRLPVVFTVRPERGHQLRATYAFDGSERDVLATGVIEAAGLSAPAARMLLLAALGAGVGHDALRPLFAVGA
jgi:L-asparaginase